MRSGVGGLAPLVAAALLAGCAPAALPRETPEAPPPVPPAGPVLVLRGATVMSAAGPTLPQGDVIVRAARIEAVGPDLPPPPGARVLDLSGRFVTPGLIDPHSHLGVYPLPRVRAHADGNERSSPFTPEVRAAESFWPGDPALRRALAGGVTTIHVLPGSANLVGGQGVTLRLGAGGDGLRPPLSSEAMRFPGAPVTMKLACGENPKRAQEPDARRAPVTRMGEVAMLRQQLERARAYAAEPPAPPKERDFGRAALAAVLSGETLIQNHCYRADEMLLRLALFREFGVAPRAFHHAVEAYKIAPALAEAGVGAVVWADWWGAKLEQLDAVPANAAMLDGAGVRVALHSDSARDVQRLNQEAAKALAAGRRAGLEVDADRALRWITANPAWILGIEDQVGTLEPGKRADLVVWSGDPFSVYSRADLVFSDGRLIYDRSSPELYPLADFELGIGQEP